MHALPSDGIMYEMWDTQNDAVEFCMLSQTGLDE